jgi:tRNA(Ile)-lysidine synthase
MLDRLTIERMRAWAGDAPFLVALSGGGDSVALLHLLAEAFGPALVRAAIVDHALRDGSAADAQRAKGFAEALGVRADILTLAWAEGANRAQQAARQARYIALCDLARRDGLKVLATGHTADDQAETVLMRAANGSTWRGLAGIAPFAYAPLWPEGRGIALARPLLNARRAALRDYLRDRRAPWIEDPANSNPAYERVRIRARLRALETEGLDPMRLVRLAARLRTRANELDRAAFALIERAARIGRDVEVLRAAWSGPGEVRRRALAVLVAAASGASRELSAKDVESLEPRVMSADHGGSTYSGVRFQPAPGGVALRREPAAILGRSGGAAALAPLDLIAGVEAVWDGRFAVTAASSGWRLAAAPDGGFVATVHGRLGDAARDLTVRPLATERIRHAFAPDINRAKP